MDPNKIILTPLQIEVINGMMLGDGCIQFSGKYSKNPRLTIGRKLTDKDYLLWQYSFVKNLCKSEIKEVFYFDNRTNKTYERAQLQSKSLACLLPIREKWYPNNYKIIPKDLILTPLTLLIWFCDDGSFIYNNISNIELKLSTHGFSKQDVLFLIDLLSKRYSAYFSECIDKHHSFIKTSSHGAQAFISEIKNIFPNCMARKSDLWANIDFNKITRDGQVFNKIRWDYLISSFILENKTSIIRAKDIAYDYDLFEKDCKPLREITRQLKRYVDDGFLSAKKINHGRGVYYEFFILNRDRIKSIYDFSKNEINKYNISYFKRAPS